MKPEKIFDILEKSPIIAATDQAGWEAALAVSTGKKDLWSLITTAY